MRQLGPVRAFLASLFGFGYVYVGRLSLAVGLLLGTLGLYALLSWTRLILRVEAFYVAAAVALAVALLQLVHPAVIAWRQREAPARFYNHWWFYGLCVIGGSAGCAVLIMTRGALFGFETYRIPSVAMEPTFQPGDFILVDAWQYRGRDPDVGDVIVFRRDGINYVKRIVAGPGDRMALRQGELERNDAIVAEPYVHAPLAGRAFGRDTAPLTLGEDEYYVLGDFRDNSMDSRTFGPIARDQIVGRVEYIWYSVADGAIAWSRFPHYVADDGQAID